MRVLADRHHADLLESLYILIEDRFGGELYVPYGMDWFDQWVWNFEREWHGDAVARQYLEGVWTDTTDVGDHVEQRDKVHPGRTIKGVTLEQARSQRWDIVLCSLPSNERGFRKLASQVGAKYGVQIGNNGQVQSTEWGDFALISSTLNGFVPPCPFVVYRQEFSLRDFRFEWPPAEKRSIASFIQCFAENKDYYAGFLQLARQNPDFDWKVYGAYGSHEPDEFACGNLESTPAVAEAMRRTRIAWHSKWWGDGMGHVIHNLGATGKPVVGLLGYYQDKLAGPFLIDGVTSWDLARHTKHETLVHLRALRDDDDYHRSYSETMAEAFRAAVNFDQDAFNVRALLESVL